MLSTKRFSSVASYAVAAAVAAMLGVSFVYVTRMKLNVDETFHYPLIRHLLAHNLHFNPVPTTLPGYHFLVFIIASVLGAESVTSVRLISFGISLCSIGAFFLLVHSVRAGDASSKTFQYAFFPLLFPFLFLIYTDVTSLLFVFLGIYLTIRGRFYLAGVAGLLACTVRQDNVIWVGFMFLLMAIELVHRLQTDSAFRLSSAKKKLRQFVRTLGANGATFVVTFALFVAFVVINSGVALGDRAMHPSFVWHFSNIYCLLFTLFFMFFPMNIANAPKIGRLVLRHRFAPLCIIAFFVLYLATFTIDHPYNTQPWAQWFLSNRILSVFLRSEPMKVLFFLPVLYSVLSLFCTTLYGPEYYLIYPLTVLQLGPEWLVDPRYYLIPCMLLLAFKEENSRVVTYISYAMYVLASGYFLHSIVTYEYFF
jgi:alpha-1,2-glucosyltransferase